MAGQSQARFSILIKRANKIIVKSKTVTTTSGQRAYSKQQPFQTKKKKYPIPLPNWTVTKHNKNSVSFT
jgi:hypothetical protein